MELELQFSNSMSESILDNNGPQNVQNRNEIFSARAEQVSIVATLLKSIAFCPKVNVKISSRGLKFIVEEGKYIQASVFLDIDLFEDYKVPIPLESEICFKIAFKELLDCLKVFCNEGRNSAESFNSNNITNATKTANTLPSTFKPSLTLSYSGDGTSLKLHLKEKNCMTKFEVRTEENYDEDLMDMELESSSTQIILKSEFLSLFLSEVDLNSPARIKFTVNPSKEMKISYTGTTGPVDIMIPSISNVIESCSCTREVSAWYSFGMIKHAFRAMGMSERTRLKIDNSGYLHLTFLLSARTNSFVEFFCLPYEIEEDDEENGSLNV